MHTHNHAQPRRELWNASGEGDLPVLIEYYAIPEPLLLRNHPTRELVCVYELVPHPTIDDAMVRVLKSASVVDKSIKN